MNHTKNNKRSKLTRQGISFLLAFVLMMSVFAPGAAYATGGEGGTADPAPCTVCNVVDCGQTHVWCESHEVWDCREEHPPVNLPLDPVCPGDDTCTIEGCTNHAPKCPGDDSCTIEGCPNHAPKCPGDDSCNIEGCPNHVKKVPEDDKKNVIKAASPRAGYQPHLWAYNEFAKVYWDVAVKIGTDNAEHFSGKRAQAVTSVKLNNKTVKVGDSTQSSNWTISSNPGTGNFAGLPQENYGDPTALSQYFPGASQVTEKTAELVITPAYGYYVTGLVVVCTARTNGYPPVTIASPFECGTFGSGNAYGQQFGFQGSGTVTATLKSLAFSHLSNTSCQNGKPDYFILITVAPLPSPLYVEYDYGNIYSKLSNDDQAVFNNPSQWLEEGLSENNLGTGARDTANTQYRYAYREGLTDDQKIDAIYAWKHYANKISPEAAQIAAKYNTYFAGWEATYYRDCENYKFSNAYTGTVAYHQEEQVELRNHVRLVAMWETLPKNDEPEDPQIMIRKKFEGLTEAPESFAIELKNGDEVLATLNKGTNTGLQWDWRIDRPDGSYKLTETGEGVEGYQLETTGLNQKNSVPAGIEFTETEKTAGYTISYDSVNYLVVKTKSVGECVWTKDTLTENERLAFENKFALGTSVSYYSGASQLESVLNYSGGTITKSGSNLIAVFHNQWTQSIYGTYSVKTPSPEYFVVNKYKQNNTELTIEKKVTGNMADVNRSFAFVVTIGGRTVTFSLKHNEGKTLTDIPIGATVTITETTAGYTASYTLNGGKPQPAPDGSMTFIVEDIVPDNVQFTNNKTATIDTGVALDSLPYIIILASVAAAAVFLVLRRRSRYED